MPGKLQRQLLLAAALGALAVLLEPEQVGAQDSQAGATALPNAAIAFRFHNQTPTSAIITQVTSGGADISNVLCVVKPDGSGVDCGRKAFETDGAADPETLRMSDDVVVLYWVSVDAMKAYCSSVQVFWSNWGGGRGGATTPISVCHGNGPPVEISAR